MAGVVTDGLDACGNICGPGETMARTVERHRPQDAFGVVQTLQSVLAQRYR